MRVWCIFHFWYRYGIVHATKVIAYLSVTWILHGLKLWIILLCSTPFLMKICGIIRFELLYFSFHFHLALWLKELCCVLKFDLFQENRSIVNTVLKPSLVVDQTIVKFESLLHINVIEVNPIMEKMGDRALVFIVF